MHRCMLYLEQVLYFDGALVFYKDVGDEDARYADAADEGWGLASARVWLYASQSSDDFPQKFWLSL